MEYINLIKQNFSGIVAQFQGKIASETINGDKWSVAFPNYKLQKANGQQFNVIGLLQIEDMQGNVKDTIFLVWEPSFSFLQGGFDNPGPVFAVGGYGRIFDKEKEKSIIRVFHILTGTYIRKYNERPMIGMVLSEEQMSYIKGI